MSPRATDATMPPWIDSSHGCAPRSPAARATGEDFFLMFRFYGPQPALFRKARRLPDLERLD
jgi:hypothetical protein